jgi:hypothetical protein
VKVDIEIASQDDRISGMTRSQGTNFADQFIEVSEVEAYRGEDVKYQSLC